jgi:hypothetical protein
MRRITNRMTYANVLSTLALFIALGGTTYAATGGNFILGESNGAGAPTRLTSPTTDAAGTLKVANTATSGGRAIQGTSAHGQGVYGHSDSNAGVVGDSNTFDGVFGVSNDADSAGVSGHGDAGGYGVFATGGSRLFHTAAVHGQSGSGNAIEGFTTGDPASGVYGQDNNASSYGVAGHSNNGTAVVGDSSNGVGVQGITSGGWAMQALGDATQSRTAGGFVKAMAYVDMLGHPNDPVQQCFNSQRPAGQATSGNCGITLSNPHEGLWYVYFGFKVDDRILQVTGSKLYDIVGAESGSQATGASDTSVLVAEYWPVKRQYDNDPFYIVVY